MDKKSAHMDPQAMAELIRRYFAGELDDAAMHALEKRSLSDPFLAEALEGFEQHPADQSAQLAALEARLQQRLAGDEATAPPLAATTAGQPETPVVKMRHFDYRWAVAAAVLLLVAVGGYQWLHQDNSSAKTTIAQEVPDHADSTTVTAVPASIAPTPAGSDSSLAAVAAAPALKKPAAPAPAITKAQRSTWADSAPAAPKEYFDGGGTPGAITPASPRVAMERTTTQVRADSTTSGYLNFERAPDETMAFKKKSARLPAKPAAELQTFGSTPVNGNADSLIAGFDKNVASGLAVKGRVVDEKGTPLPGVVVRYKGASTAVQTNMDGLFSLPANGIDARKVELQYVGFNKIDTLLYASNDVKNLTLKQDSQGLNDVVVVGYSTGASSSDALPGYEAPRPEAGYDSLQRYLNKSLQVAGARHTKMRIVFTVTPAGKLENFRILNGVSDFVDQQVIELLKEGPAWKPASDARPAKVRLAVKVPAPKK
ncbi:hypothetical protein DCC81_01810 [Chitinophaga parva]|uniref:TonB C-terminal domain-containing protein n=1 Tax=Chitinophaga parva TaxID=2169414 RepID=A0A2T7BKP7_9BACT|nr:carboxypeptidase-like regulatory domain-containing protein [Chitinophaga parva]PUZ28245.1 hypothetical protein DCC81_01810 [Chitinophaga parva]